MNDHDLKMDRGCDTILAASANAMLDMGAEPERILERMLNFGVTFIVAQSGGARAAEVMRKLADKVDAGSFGHMDPSAPGKHN